MELPACSGSCHDSSPLPRSPVWADCQDELPACGFRPAAPFWHFRPCDKWLSPSLSHIPPRGRLKYLRALPLVLPPRGQVRAPFESENIAGQRFSYGFSTAASWTTPRTPSPPPKRHTSHSTHAGSQGWTDPTRWEEAQLYLNLLWGRADSLSSFVSHRRRETGLANGHTMHAECGGVVVKSFVEGPGTEGRAGTSPLNLPVPSLRRLPWTPGRTHTNVMI